jgi:hypothetical protein
MLPLAKVVNVPPSSVVEAIPRSSLIGDAQGFVGGCDRPNARDMNGQVGDGEAPKRYAPRA